MDPVKAAQGDFGRASGASTGRTSLLAKASERRFVVQDFTRFPESIEWRLGRAYLDMTGTTGFLRDRAPIPWAINNDGNLSANAAELLFQSVNEAEEDGALEEEILVLEIGTGVGLFARLFLDAFRQGCAEAQTDYYETAPVRRGGLLGADAAGCV